MCCARALHWHTVRELDKRALEYELDPVDLSGIEGGGPAFVKASALVRYRLRDLLAWESQRLAAHTSGIRKCSPARDDEAQ